MHPIANVRWVDPNTLHSNLYNPNKVFPPELELLKTSILEDGWTMPIVAREDGEIVDGFHRWTLAKTDEDFRARVGRLCPVVFLRPGKTKADQRFSTVRHNRARGQHGLLKMGEILRQLQAEGLTPEEIASRMGMEMEEYERLIDLRGTGEIARKESFGKGWKPV